MKAAFISEQGIRLEMEDAHYLDTNFDGQGWVFGGVYDGHSGKHAAAFASERLHLLFLNKLMAAVPPQRAFIESYEEISAALKHRKSGTTAANFLIKDGFIYTANAGDSRAILISTDTVTQLSIDHRLDNIEERNRIQSEGGIISYPYTVRGNSGLMPTRTLGDEYFKPIGIIATPSVSEHVISNSDIVLIAACDGLFDVMSNEEVAEFGRQNPEPQSLLEDLKKEVIFNRGGTDNLTIIAVQLSHHYIRL